MLQVASISQLTVSRLSRQCGILNISQPYRPPRPVTGIALLLLKEACITHFTAPLKNKLLEILNDSCQDLMRGTVRYLP
jgi:hypothetical protein